MSQLLLINVALVVSLVLFFREQPILVPIPLVLSVGMAIVGITLMTVGNTIAYAWFMPLAIFTLSFLIYRLYEGWGM